MTNRLRIEGYGRKVLDIGDRRIIVSTEPVSMLAVVAAAAGLMLLGPVVGRVAGLRHDCAPMFMVSPPRFGFKGVGGGVAGGAEKPV